MTLQHRVDLKSDSRCATAACCIREDIFVHRSLSENLTGRRCYRLRSNLASLLPLLLTSGAETYLAAGRARQGTLPLLPRDFIGVSTRTATAKTGTTEMCPTRGFLPKALAYK